MSKTSNTNWILLSGPPCAGKTTSLNMLGNNNFRIVPEVGREVITRYLNSGKSLKEIYADGKKLQTEILERKIAVHRQLNRNEEIILEDGLPDTCAHLSQLNIDWGYLMPLLDEFHYRQVFLLDPLPYVQDEVRLHSQKSIEELQWHKTTIYRELGYNPVVIPVASKEVRVQLILDQINSHQSQLRLG